MNDQVGMAVATKLLEIGAIKLSPDNPFTWASGWKSPIYCDNRLALSYPQIRTYIKEELGSMIRSKFRDVEAIAGVATAGIPQGSLVADLLELPFLYVRDKSKDHGMENQIEGKVVEGQQLVVIEDLISTGGSSLKAISALRASGMHVMGMVAIFTYGFSTAEESFKHENVDTLTLCNYRQMLEAALQMKYIEQKDVELLDNWSKNPGGWGR